MCSHTWLLLIETGNQLLVFQCFSKSSPIALERVRELAGPATAPRLRQMQGDIGNPRDFEKALTKEPSGIDDVIPFAGLKANGESVEKPLQYWNLNGSRRNTLVFSSSATLYGYPERVPIPETAPIQPINPYGHSKAAVEQLLHAIFNILIQVKPCVFP